MMRMGRWLYVALGFALVLLAGTPAAWAQDGWMPCTGSLKCLADQGYIFWRLLDALIAALLILTIALLIRVIQLIRASPRG